MTRRLFGTDGIRGEAGRPPLDPATLRAVGRAAALILARDLPHAPRVILGRDTRESGPSIQAALAAGLAEAGARVRSAGVLPTPGVSLLARGPDFDAGVMVSASHNPHADNGIKIFSSAGTKLPDAIEDEIEAAIASAGPMATPDAAPPGPADDAALQRAYLDWLLERARATGAAFGGIRLVADCAHGAASTVLPALLAALGVRADVIHAAPDGRNINEGCGSLHLQPLAEAVRDLGADLGVAVDGDADRALFVDERGRTVDGDNVLLVAAMRLASSGRLRGGGVVGTIMSNHGLEISLARQGLRLVRERVGDRHVLARMQAEGFNLGGEPSGHCIFLDEAPTGDGIVTMIQVLAAMAASGASLAGMADLMERTPQVLRNLRVRQRRPLEQLDGFPRLLEDWRHRLAGDGRIVVRYSGTESLLRVMVEGPSREIVETCAEELCVRLEAELGAG